MYGTGEGGGEGGDGEKVNTLQHESGLFATLMQVAPATPTLIIKLHASATARFLRCCLCPGEWVCVWGGGGGGGGGA